MRARREALHVFALILRTGNGPEFFFPLRGIGSEKRSNAQEHKALAHVNQFKTIGIV